MSVDSLGVPGNGNCFRPSISDDGSHIVFSSFSTNLVPSDTDVFRDVYVHDKCTGLTELISVSTAGVTGNANSLNWESVISPGGRYVAFDSLADNLVPGDTNGVEDVFLRDRFLRQTTRVSIGSNGAQSDALSNSGSVSADGRFVAFRSDSDLLVPGDTNGLGDVFVRDRGLSQTTLVSLALGGSSANGLSGGCSISTNGRFVTFVSFASNLVAGDTNGVSDIFVHDLSTGLTERVSVDSFGVQANGQCNHASASSEGRYVVFWSDATNLVASDTNGKADIFVHDRVSGTTVLASVNSQGMQANESSFWPSISPEGRHVAFESVATNLVPGSGGFDCYVHNLNTGQTRMVSVDSSGNPGTDFSLRPSIATDGRAVAFKSIATNLVPGPAFPLYFHVYVHTTEGCPFPVAYCQPSQTSLPSCQMGLYFVHAPQAGSPDGFAISTTAPGGNLAIGIVGDSGTANVPLGTLGGSLCVQAPFLRLPPQTGGGSPQYCDGFYQYTLADIAAATPLAVTGLELFFQIWSRDPANPDGFALSDAVRFTVCP